MTDPYRAAPTTEAMRASRWVRLWCTVLGHKETSDADGSRCSRCHYRPVAPAPIVAEIAVETRPAFADAVYYVPVGPSLTRSQRELKEAFGTIKAAGYDVERMFDVEYRPGGGTHLRLRADWKPR